MQGRVEHRQHVGPLGRLEERVVVGPAGLGRALRQQGAQLRAHLLRLAGDRHLLLLVMPHIACDGWSLQIVLHEYRSIVRDARSAPGWQDKLRYLLLAPGWHHAGQDKRARTLRLQAGIEL